MSSPRSSVSTTSSIGPQIWERVHIIPFLDGRWDGQHDRFYLVNVEPFEPAPRLTVEQLRAENLMHIRWWTQDELAAFVPTDTELFAPRKLAHLVAALLADGVPDVAHRNGGVAPHATPKRRSMSWTATMRRPARRTAAVARSPDEAHRAATSLELFYDLCFVVAVSQASSELHHLIVERRFADAVIGFSAAFFGIWWAWVNFVWFASGHDSDDVPFRLLTLVQMAGVLILAAGIHDAFIHFDFTTITIGYVVIRLGLVGMWLRVARDQPDHRRRAMRFVIGITAVQVALAVASRPAR